MRVNVKPPPPQKKQEPFIQGCGNSGFEIQTSFYFSVDFGFLGGRESKNEKIGSIRLHVAAPILFDGVV